MIRLALPEESFSEIIQSTVDMIDTEIGSVVDASDITEKQNDISQNLVHHEAWDADLAERN